MPKGVPNCIAHQPCTVVVVSVAEQIKGLSKGEVSLSKLLEPCHRPGRCPMLPCPGAEDTSSSVTSIDLYFNRTFGTLVHAGGMISTYMNLRVAVPQCRVTAPLSSRGSLSQRSTTFGDLLHVCRVSSINFIIKIYIPTSRCTVARENAYN